MRRFSFSGRQSAAAIWVGALIVASSIVGVSIVMNRGEAFFGLGDFQRKAAMVSGPVEFDVGQSTVSNHINCWERRRIESYLVCQKSLGGRDGSAASQFICASRIVWSCREDRASYNLENASFYEGGRPAYILPSELDLPVIGNDWASGRFAALDVGAIKENPRALQFCQRAFCDFDRTPGEGGLCVTNYRQDYGETSDHKGRTGVNVITVLVEKESNITEDDAYEGGVAFAGTVTALLLLAATYWIVINGRRR